jgi:ribosome-binding factor A
MPEHRGREHHYERLGEALREEIATILEGELGDPRIGLATVTEVRLAPDGRSARVFVSVEGDDAEADSTLKGLEAATGYIRRELTERLRLRKAPELHFVIDRSQQFEARVEQILKRVSKKQKPQ